MDLTRLLYMDLDTGRLRSTSGSEGLEVSLLQLKSITNDIDKNGIYLNSDTLTYNLSIAGGSHRWTIDDNEMIFSVDEDGCFLTICGHKVWHAGNLEIGDLSGLEGRVGNLEAEIPSIYSSLGDKVNKENGVFVNAPSITVSGSQFEVLSTHTAYTKTAIDNRFFDLDVWKEWVETEISNWEAPDAEQLDATIIEDIGIGDLAYVVKSPENPDQLYVGKADPTDEDRMPVIGIVSMVEGDQCKIKRGGTITIPDLQAGDVYFVDRSGTLTNKPLNPESEEFIFSQEVGVAISDKKLLIDPKYVIKVKR